MKRDNSYLLGNKHALGTAANSTAFKKGQVPWNKGISYSVHGSEATRFKKGQRGRNWKPVGTVTFRKDKTGTLRAFVKIAEPNIWKLRAVVIWEERYGPISRGLVLHHRNEDALHDVLGNLCVLTRAAHLNEHRKKLAVAARNSPKRMGWGIGGKRSKA